MKCADREQYMKQLEKMKSEKTPATPKPESPTVVSTKGKEGKREDLWSSVDIQYAV